MSIDIEITVGLQLAASMSFRVDKAEWEAMSPVEQNELIEQHAVSVRSAMDRSGNATPGASASVYFVLEGVNSNPLDIYEPT